MIHYFLSCGDEQVSDMFTPYVWGKCGIGTRLEKALLANYGPDLKLLLIQYYVEGKFEVNGPKKPKVGNYSTKNKDISVAVTVTQEKFHLRNEFERREFVIDSSLEAIKLVKARLTKKRLHIDFDSLQRDFEIQAQEYLKYPDPLARTT